MEYFDPFTDLAGGGPRPGAPAPAPAPTPGGEPGPTPSLDGTSVQTDAGYTPDWTNLIKSNSAYLATQNATTMSGEQAAAKRRQVLRDAYVRYGGDLPPGFQDPYGDINQATKDAATGNQQSILAGLGQRYGQSVEQFKRGLSARGALQSSELTYGQDQLDRGLAQQRYDAANQFTGEANQAVGGYVDTLGQNALTMAQGIGQAEANVYANPSNRPSAPTYAQYDAGASAQHHVAVYSADGKLYDDQGNPFNPPGADSQQQPFDPANLYSGGL